MNRLELLPPEFYKGELLCPRCGDNGKRQSFIICANKMGYSHQETCAKYHYGDLCSQCSAEVKAEIEAESQIST